MKKPLYLLVIDSAAIGWVAGIIVIRVLRACGVIVEDENGHLVAA